MDSRPLKRVDILRHELKALRFILDNYHAGKLDRAPGYMLDEMGLKAGVITAEEYKMLQDADAARNGKGHIVKALKVPTPDRTQQLETVRRIKAALLELDALAAAGRSCWRNGGVSAPLLSSQL